MIKLAFTGNPNVGKSALINAIAGSKLKVGNWPGVTVEKKEAVFFYKGEEIHLVDLPGVYSLSPYSLEEKITRDFILEENPDIVINVVDSTNLERNLYLSYLIKELDKPTIMALNLFDEFEKLNYKLDIEKFESLVEMKVVPVSALKKIGITELMDQALNIVKNNNKSFFSLPFGKNINSLVKKIATELKNNIHLDELFKTYSPEFVAIKLIENDEQIINKLQNNYNFKLNNKFEKEILKLETEYDNDRGTILAEHRYSSINQILSKTFTTSLQSRMDFTDKVDKILLNRVFGLPLFFLIMSGMMTLVFSGSAPFVKWISKFFGSFLAKYVGIFVEGTPNWLNSLILDGILGGVGGILVFTPIM
ncbi:ferrous iron transporter B, partial [Fusobacterium sp.]|uniref:ferrous iron transporter B n=1 Tax=Fusobacterium sp. TaxID=68766 RepID=UPI0026281BF1